MKVDVRKGRTRSPTLFNIFLDYVMTEVKPLDPHFLLMDHMSTDIRYAIDTTLVSAVFRYTTIGNHRAAESAKLILTNAPLFLQRETMKL